MSTTIITTFPLTYLTVLIPIYSNTLSLSLSSHRIASHSHKSNYSNDTDTTRTAPPNMPLAYALLRDKLLRLYPSLESDGWTPTSCHAAIRVVPPRTQLGTHPPYLFFIPIFLYPSLCNKLGSSRTNTSTFNSHTPPHTSPHLTSHIISRLTD